MLEEAQPISRREQAKGGRRARIVDATYALLREVGIADLSVKMIADQASVSPATVYNLFGTKAVVLEKVYERDLADFQARIATTPSADSLERIFDCVTISVEHYSADERFYRSIMKMPSAEPADNELIDMVTSSRANFWGDLVQAAIDDGHLRADTDTEQVGVVMTHLFRGALSPWVINQTTIEQWGADVIYGYAAILWSFATRASQQRLQKLLETTATRKRAKAQAQ